MSNNMISYSDLPRELQSYRAAWDDLGAVLEEYGGLGYVPDPGTGAHIYSPLAMERLEHLIHSPHLGRHHGDRHFGHIQRLLQHLHGLMAQSEQLKWEKRLWHEKANTITTVEWIALAADTTSSTATLSAPYSGVNYMILDMLTIAELMPPFVFTKISFAGIDFATPSINQVAYDAAAGVTGTPSAAQKGMGPAALYTNKTAPDGSRGWMPWTGWILSAAAQVFLQVRNLDQNNARNISVDFLERSSPCGAFEQTQYSTAWHVSQGYHNAVNAIYGAVLGLGGQQGGHPSRDPGWTQGQAMHSFPSGMVHGRRIP